MKEIGQRDFYGLRRATGVLAPEDTEELHWRAFRVMIGVKARKDTGEMENVVRKYLFDADGPPARRKRKAAKRTEWRKAA